MTLGACTQFVIAHLKISLCLSLPTRSNNRSLKCATNVKNNRNLKRTLRLRGINKISEDVPQPNPVPKSNTPSQHCTRVSCPIPIPTWFVPVSDTSSQHCTHVQHPHPNTVCTCLTPHPNTVCTCVCHPIPTLFVPVSDTPSQLCT